MNIEGMQVEYLQGTKEEYSQIQDKKENTLYFCTDTKEIFVGDKLFSKTSQILDSIPTDETPGNFGCIYYCEENQSMYLYSEKSWIMISSLKADNLVNGGVIAFDAFEGFKYSNTINLKNIELFNPGDPLGIMELEAGVPTIINNKNADLSVWDRYAFALSNCMVGGTIVDTAANLDLEVSVDLSENLTLVNNKITIDENKIRTHLTEIGASGGFSAEMVEQLINTYGIITKELNADGIEETWYSTVMSMEGVTLAKISVREDLLETRLTISPETSSEIPFLPISTLGQTSEYMPPALCMSKENTLCNYGLSHLRCDNELSNTVDYITFLNAIGVAISLEDFNTDDPITLIKNKLKEAVDNVYIKAPNLVLLEAANSESTELTETPSIYDIKIAAGETDVDEDLKKQWQISVDDLISKIYMIAYKDSSGEGCTDLNIFDGYSISFNKADYTEKVEAPEIYFKSIENTDASIYLSSPSNQKDSKTIEALLNDTSAILFSSNYPHNSLTLYCIKGDVVITEKYNDTLATDIKKVVTETLKNSSDLKKAVIDTYNGITRITGTVDFLYDTEIHPGYYLFEADTIINGPKNIALSPITNTGERPYASFGDGNTMTNKYEWTNTYYANKVGTYELPYSIFLEVSEYPDLNSLELSSRFNPPEVSYFRQFVLKTPGVSYTLVQPIIKNIETGEYTANPFGNLGGTAISNLDWIASSDGKLSKSVNLDNSIIFNRTDFSADLIPDYGSLQYYVANACSGVDDVIYYSDTAFIENLKSYLENPGKYNFCYSTLNNTEIASGSTAKMAYQATSNNSIPLDGSSLSRTFIASEYKHIPVLPEKRADDKLLKTITYHSSVPSYDIGIIPPNAIYITEDYQTYKYFYVEASLLALIDTVFYVEGWGDNAIWFRADGDYYITFGNPKYTFKIAESEGVGSLLYNQLSSSSSTENTMPILISNGSSTYSNWNFLALTDSGTNYSSEANLKKNTIYLYGLTQKHKSIFFEVTEEESAGRYIGECSLKYINAQEHLQEKFNHGNNRCCIKVILTSKEDATKHEEYYFTIDPNKVNRDSYFTLSDSPDTKNFILSKNIFKYTDYELLGVSSDDLESSISTYLNSNEIASFGNWDYGRFAGKDFTIEDTPAYYQRLGLADDTGLVLIRNVFGQVLHQIPLSYSRLNIEIFDDWSKYVIVKVPQSNSIDPESIYYMLIPQGHCFEWAQGTSNLSHRKITTDGCSGANIYANGEVFERKPLKALDDGSYYLTNIDYENKGYGALSTDSITDTDLFFTFEDKDGNKLLNNVAASIQQPKFCKGFKMSYDLIDYYLSYNGTPTARDTKNVILANDHLCPDNSLVGTYSTINLNIGDYYLKNVSHFYRLTEKLGLEATNKLKELFSESSYENNFSYNGTTYEISPNLSTSDFDEYFTNYADQQNASQTQSISHGTSFNFVIGSDSSSTRGFIIDKDNKKVICRLNASDLAVSDSTNYEEAFEKLKNYALTLFEDNTSPQFRIGSTFGSSSSNIMYDSTTNRSWYPIYIPIRDGDNPLLKVYDKDGNLVEITFNYCKKESNIYSTSFYGGWEADETFAEYGYHFSRKISLLINPKTNTYSKVVYTQGNTTETEEKTYLDELFHNNETPDYGNLSPFGFSDELNTIKIFSKEDPNSTSISCEITLI